MDRWTDEVELKQENETWTAAYGQTAGGRELP